MCFGKNEKLIGTGPRNISLQEREREIEMEGGRERQREGGREKDSDRVVGGGERERNRETERSEYKTINDYNI